jgi:hypothetical protein
VIIYPAIQMIINQEAEHLMNVIVWEYDQTIGKAPQERNTRNGMDKLTSG